MTKPILKLGHAWGKYVYNNDATCTEDGTETATCTRCKEKNTRTKEETASHVYVDKESGTAVCKVCEHTADIFVTENQTVTGLTKAGYILIPDCYSVGEYVFEDCPNVQEITIEGNISLLQNEFCSR